MKALGRTRRRGGTARFRDWRGVEPWSLPHGGTLRPVGPPHDQWVVPHDVLPEVHLAVRATGRARAHGLEAGTAASPRCPLVRLTCQANHDGGERSDQHPEEEPRDRVASLRGGDKRGGSTEDRDPDQEPHPEDRRDTYKHLIHKRLPRTSQPAMLGDVQSLGWWSGGWPADRAAWPGRRRPCREVRSPCPSQLGADCRLRLETRCHPSCRRTPAPRRSTPTAEAADD
jgi:hypothetical protein